MELYDRTRPRKIGCYVTAPKTEFGLDWLAQKESGKDKTTLFPFDEDDFTINLKNGSSIAIDAEYNGNAQSLYQLQVGVTTALNILTRFGAGSGTISNGKITIAKFNQIAEKMGDFLKIKECANVMLEDNPNFGSIMSGCFDPSEIMEVFGWRGLLIAPAMVAGPVVSFFRSEFNSVGDILNGRDRYSIAINHKKSNPLATYISTWQVHGVQEFTINANSTGSMTWNFGPCLDPFENPDSPMCNGHAILRFTPNADGSLTGTYDSVNYTTWDGKTPPEGFDPSTDTPHQGETFWVKHNDAHTLETGGERPPGNPYLCDEYAEAHNDSTYKICGA